MARKSKRRSFQAFRFMVRLMRVKEMFFEPRVMDLLWYSIDELHLTESDAKDMIDRAVKPKRGEAFQP